MKVINLIGQPGAGKSTTAAMLFAQMKLQGLEVELVTEYAKDVVWEERDNLFAQQDYIFAKQHRRIARLKGKVDYVITDSPLLLSILYTPLDFPKTFVPFVREVNSLYDNEYFFINRTKAYNPNGRNQTESESDDIGVAIESFLDEESIRFTKVNGDENASWTILKEINGEL